MACQRQARFWVGAVWVLATGSWAGELRDGVVVRNLAPVCHRNSSNFDSCLTTSLQTVIQNIGRDGIPEIDMQPIDPLHVPFQINNTFSSFLYDFKSTFSRNVNIGLAGSKINQVRTNLKDRRNLKFEIDYDIPDGYLTGEYLIKGKLAGFSINGDGPYAINMTRIYGTMKLYGKLIKPKTKAGVKREEFLKFTRIDMWPKFKHVHLDFHEVIKGSPGLSKVAMQFFNTYWDEVLTQLLPFINDLVDPAWRSVTDQFTLKVPYDQMLPP